MSIKTFTIMGLFGLNLKKETVPAYGDAHGKVYPQTIPMALIGLCFMNSLLKLGVPLVLEEVYSQMSASQLQKQDYAWLVGAVIMAIFLSHGMTIAYGLVLSLYRLNVRREVSQRIITNNFTHYQKRLQSTCLSVEEEGNMELWMKANTRLSVYLHNYYESYLSLIFECFNIFAIVIYLFFKLSFALFFGLAIAGLVMYKTITTAGVMTNVRFRNIALRARRLKLLEGFFSRVSEFKMSWLDRWIYDRVCKIEKEFQMGLRDIKLLDCWCVALWQFTGVGISSIVITAYFLMGFNEAVDPQSVFTPSTFVYLLGMLNFPLNALSWYIAGIRTAHRAIEQLKDDAKIPQEVGVCSSKIEEEMGNWTVRKEIELKIEHSAQDRQKITVPVRQFQRNSIYSVTGEHAESFLAKLPFLLGDKVVRGYVQQNAWLAPSVLQSICMQPNLSSLSQEEQASISELLQLFHCADIPLHTNTQNYSGGEKLRVSLVRAFHLGQVVVVNSSLLSLDQQMRVEVQERMRKLVANSNRNYTVFIRENEQIADEVITFTEKTQEDIELSFEPIKRQPIPAGNIPISQTITNFVHKGIQQLSRASKCQQQREASLNVTQIDHNDKQKDKSGVSFDTFRVYYQSSKHIWFLCSMLFVTLLSNYYNYYVNTYINLAHYDEHQVVVIVVITLAFAVGLFFRSYLFADANLDQAARICSQLDRNIIMEQLSFYQSEEQLKDSLDDPTSKSQLICILSSDTETIADHFPFSTNIFANNITMIISCVAVIIIEVPQMFLLVCLLIAYSHSLNKVSHRKDEALKAALKQKEVQVYNAVSLLQSARKYVLLHHRLAMFSGNYERLREQQMELDWLSERYRGYINMKYKGVMSLFMLVSVAAYSYINVFTEQSSGGSSGLALLIQYTIQLSNYLLYFTMSIWEIKGQAVSIERVKPYLTTKPSVAARITAADNVIAKLRKMPEEGTDRTKLQQKSKGTLIDIRSLDYAYDANPTVPIFKGLDLQILSGERVVIQGRSGAGKTTLYKLLTSAYPSILDLTQQPFHVSFSPQHPLLLPDSTSLEENLDPYQLKRKLKAVQAVKTKHGLDKERNPQQLSYQQKIVVNNLRAHLYGRGGLTVYDEPQEVMESEKETCLIVTHHHPFRHSRRLVLSDGQLVACND